VLTDAQVRTLSPEAVAPDTAAANAALAALSKGVPRWWEIGAERMRALRAAGGTQFPPPWRSERGRTLHVSAPGRDIPLRIVAPERPDAVYLHFHAGGWVLGGADQQDTLLETLVHGANLACVSVDYRLAPEHRWPAAPDDCEAAAVWLAQNTRELFGTGRLLIGGESAGAHLAALTLVRLRDRHGLRPFTGACLSYGAYDLSLTPSVRLADEDALVLNRRDVEAFLAAFLPPEADVRDPDVSPLYADLRGLCRALFTVGGADPLVDDTLFMAARWAAAGNGAELAIQPGGVHGFLSLDSRIGREARDRLIIFLRDAVQASSPANQETPA